MTTLFNIGDKIEFTAIIIQCHFIYLLKASSFGEYYETRNRS